MPAPPGVALGLLPADLILSFTFSVSSVPQLPKINFIAVPLKNNFSGHVAVIQSSVSQAESQQVIVSGSVHRRCSRHVLTHIVAAIGFVAIYAQAARAHHGPVLDKVPAFGAAFFLSGILVFKRRPVKVSAGKTAI